MTKAIANREIFVGITADETRQSWEAPAKNNISVGGYGNLERWVYRSERAEAQYVYIENGVVTSMQSPSE